MGAHYSTLYFGGVRFHGEDDSGQIELKVSVDFSKSNKPGFVNGFKVVIDEEAVSYCSTIHETGNN